jgi:hypothetical protein
LVEEEEIEDKRLREFFLCLKAEKNFNSVTCSCVAELRGADFFIFSKQELFADFHSRTPLP